MKPSPVAKAILNTLLAIVSIVYPFLWYFGKDYVPFTTLGLIMAGLWFIRMLMQEEKTKKIISLILSIFFIAIVIWYKPHAMYWYPVWVSLFMLSIFASSLLTKQSLIERLARLKHPDLPPEGVHYTRKVTIIWCGFFCLNITITGILILLGLYKFWSLYTGFISYILMGILFAGEFAYRKWILRI